MLQLLGRGWCEDKWDPRSATIIVFPLSPAATEAAQVGNPHSVMSPESRRSVPPKTQQEQFSYKPPRALISLISLLLRQQPCSGEITLAGDKLPVSKQH